MQSDTRKNFLTLRDVRQWRELWSLLEIFHRGGGEIHPAPGPPCGLDWRSCWLSFLEGTRDDLTDTNCLVLDNNSSPLPFSGEAEVTSDQETSQAVVGKALRSISLLWKEILIAWSFIHIMVLLFLPRKDPCLRLAAQKSILADAQTISLLCLWSHQLRVSC